MGLTPDFPEEGAVEMKSNSDKQWKLWSMMNIKKKKTDIQ